MLSCPHGDIDGALQHFFEGIEGKGSWSHLPAAAKQQLRDNVYTLLGQLGENRKPYGKADAQAITTPTLFIGGTNTKGSLVLVLRALSCGRTDRLCRRRAPLDVRAGAVALLSDRDAVSY
jgi:hypothetical protein